MKQESQVKRIYWIAGLLVSLVIVFVVSIVFLNPSSVGNENFLWFLNLWALVWGLIFVLVLSLTFLLARNLIKLFFERSGVPAEGKIKTKLILTFTLFSLFPSLIMFFVAFGLINQNLTTWVSAPTEQLQGASNTIARKYYQQRRSSAVNAALALAKHLEGGPHLTVTLADQARSFDFAAVRVLSRDGTIRAAFGDWPGFSLPEFTEGVLEDSHYYSLQHNVPLESERVDQVVVGVPLQSYRDGSAILMGRMIDSPSITLQALQIDEAQRTYQELRETLAMVRLNYGTILALTTLAVIFGFVWLGSYIARKLTTPLEALAEGAHQLAGGNLDHRVGVEAADELGIVVQSFNRMAEQLTESRRKLEVTNVELKSTNVRLNERRRYIETVLQNIATGVLTIDEDGVIQTVNEAAALMLQVPRDKLAGIRMTEIAHAGLFEELERMKKRATMYGSHRRQLTLEWEDRKLFVAATMTIMENTNRGTEYLVVMDDLTELIRAEKFAAWQEVARRLAHEIKNPLTPIQLSAERIQRRFQKLTLPPTRHEMREFASVVDQASDVIRAESEILKQLVAEFSRFARMPICNPEPVDLHELIDQALDRYDGRLDPINVERIFDQRIDKISLDRDQFQRVLVNLIDNSLDALAEENGEKTIRVSTRLRAARKAVSIEFADTGTGISSADYDRLFLPYFSTKKKGTGLGLAIIRQIVNEHEGFIRAEPNLPRGTRFIIELPLNATQRTGR